ncbi:hypothetical protein [Williamsia deligens]|uniref:N-acetyltransferase domain-containing protein n=1 Tax=Williamsia deligens TaxID=321325 RepID=A0ABW3GAI5_9NOCA|nr:hypothetical protein [Williamsia deligens]MCP2192570.1 hypothetical protein [Williamsia deligens]
MITVVPVRSAADWKDFTAVYRTVYADDPYGLPDEPIDLGATLRSPATELRDVRHSQAFVALDGLRPVGRIAAIHDTSFTDHTGESIGFFGFYEAVDDYAVAEVLLDAASSWLAERGLTMMAGPFSPSMFYSAGVLVDDAGTLPLIGMPHNPTYYAAQLEKWGMAGMKDFYSYRFDEPYQMFCSEKFARHKQLYERVSARSEVTFRTMSYRTLRRDAEIVRELYNTTFQDFWGFSPLSRAEMWDLLKMMLPVLDRELTLLAEYRGKPVAFFMGIPDANQAMARSARHRNRLVRDLTTLRYVKGRRRTDVVDGVRVDMMLVDSSCPDRSVASQMVVEMWRRIEERGYTRMEGAPVLDDSEWMKGSVLSRIEMSPYRTYRIFSRDIAPATSAG